MLSFHSVDGYAISAVPNIIVVWFVCQKSKSLIQYDDICTRHLNEKGCMVLVCLWILPVSHIRL